MTFSLNPKQYDIVEENLESIGPFSTEETTFAVFDLKEILKNNNINIGATYSGIHKYGIIPPPVLYADRKITGIYLHIYVIVNLFRHGKIDQSFA